MNLPPLGSNWPFPTGDSRGWPFPYVNGEQTPDSKALQANKSAHSAPKFDPSTCEESPL